MKKKEAVDLFLRNVFDEALVADLNQMLSVPKGLDFAIIILVCSGIELIGALKQGHLGSPGKRFKEAIVSYFPNAGYRECKDVFYNLFRCGLAHQAFIKPGTATTRNPDYKHCHLKRVYIEDEEGTVLFIHPNLFAEHFFQALEEFRRSLQDDPRSLERAYCAIQKIYKEYPNINNSIEICTSLPPSQPDETQSVTKMPLPTRILASEVSRF